jgi:GT2 family glycosyltransferase
MKPKVGIIILNYKNIKDTIECLESVKKIDYRNYFIVVVDNFSEDGSYETLKEMYPEMDVLESGENRGYAAGNNYGIKYALNKGAEYICILNNDVVIDLQCLSKLVSYMEKHSDTGIAGANICEYYKPDTVQSTGMHINFFKSRTPYINEGRPLSEVINQKPLECDAVCGACMLVRKNVVDQIGLIPEIYFLFYEETEWCLCARRAGFKIVSLFDAVVYHKGSATMKKTNTFVDYYTQRNAVLFERRNANFVQNIVFALFLTARVFYHLLKGDKVTEFVNFKAIRDGYKMRF